MVRKVGPKGASTQLTEAELELMSILWSRGASTVHDVQKALPPTRPLAYTSVSTVLRILEQKGVVRAEARGPKAHAYIPVLSKADYERSAVQRLVSTVFDNAPAALVARLLDAGEVSDGELARIKALLDERLPR
jgi:predicted transcriptional regulator